MEIFKLWGSILVDNDQANKSISDTDKKGQGLGDTLAKGAVTAGAWALALAGAAVAVGLAMFDAANKTAEYADAIDKLAERTGFGREELQRWKYAAEQSGADVEKLEVGIKKLSDQMDGAANGNKTAIESFERLGISMADLEGKTPDEVFGLVASQLADMEQGAARNALGNDLLGKSYVELMPLLNAGSEGINDLKSRADELGIVMSDSAVKSAVVYGDTMDDVNAMFQSVTNTIGTAAIPMLQTLLEWVIEYLPVIQEFVTNVFNKYVSPAIAYMIEKLTLAYQWFSVYILPALQALADYIVKNWPAMQKTAETVLGEIIEMATALWKLFEVSLLPIIKALFNFVQDNWPAIQATFAVVFGAISKHVETVWKGLELVVSWSTKAIEALTKFFTKQNEGQGGGLMGGSFGLGGSFGSSIKSKGMPPGLATGGVIQSAGRVLVGENGPEFLDLPQNAKVTPLDKSGINIAISGNTIIGDNDPAIDHLCDAIVKRLARLGVAT